MSDLVNTEILLGVLESAPDSMLVLDLKGAILMVNSQTEKLFGYSREELLGRPIEVLIPERFRKRHVHQRDEYLRNPKVRPMGAGLDLFGLTRSGREIPVEISLSPLHTKSGTYVTSAIRDVTSRKLIEGELISARQQAEAANRAKTEFLANMSHEIRTPLAGILGYVEMLTEYERSDEQKKTYAGRIRSCADNLTALIDDILDLSKVEAGLLKVETIPTVLSMEVDAVVSILQGRAAERKIDLLVEKQAGLPAQLLSDPTRLKQILANLIGNSIKFTEKGSVTLRVTSGMNRIEFTVLDTGCGISNEGIPNLFKPFVQADSSVTRKFGGTGLGLALSQRLARALGGDLELVKSELGRGSVFRFWIPRNEVVSSETGKAPVQAETSLEGLTALIVEDNQDNAAILKEFLIGAGATSELARDGQMALSLLKDRSYDVILMDIQMPGMDGVETLKRIREMGIATPAIAVTAHAFSEERARCREAGFADFLAKPVSGRDLRQSLKRYHNL